MSWAFAVDNGWYKVDLHLIEQRDTFVEGSRVFDVSMEGAIVFDDLDVYKEAGAALKAITKSAIGPR